MTKRRKIFHIILITLLEINALFTIIYFLCMATLTGWNWIPFY